MTANQITDNKKRSVLTAYNELDRHASPVTVEMAGSGDLLCVQIFRSQPGTLDFDNKLSPGVSAVVVKVSRGVPDFRASHRTRGGHLLRVPLVDEFRPSRRDPGCLIISHCKSPRNRQKLAQGASPVS